MRRQSVEDKMVCLKWAMIGRAESQTVVEVDSADLEILVDDDRSASKLRHPTEARALRKSTRAE